MNSSFKVCFGKWKKIIVIHIVIDVIYLIFHHFMFSEVLVFTNGDCDQSRDKCFHAVV